MVLLLLFQNNCSNAFIISQKCTGIVLVKLSGKLFCFNCLKGPVVRKCLRIIQRGSAVQCGIALVSSHTQCQISTTYCKAGGLA